MSYVQAVLMLQLCSPFFLKGPRRVIDLAPYCLPFKSRFPLWSLLAFPLCPLEYTPSCLL